MILCICICRGGRYTTLNATIKHNKLRNLRCRFTLEERGYNEGVGGGGGGGGGCTAHSRVWRTLEERAGFLPHILLLHNKHAAHNSRKFHNVPSSTRTVKRQLYQLPNQFSLKTLQVSLPADDGQPIHIKIPTNFVHEKTAQGWGWVCTPWWSWSIRSRYRNSQLSSYRINSGFRLIYSDWIIYFQQRDSWNKWYRFTIFIFYKVLFRLIVLFENNMSTFLVKNRKLEKQILVYVER